MINWQIMFAVILLALSAIFYCVHYIIFKDAHHIFIYMLGDIGFLFLDVLIVMLVLHRLLEYREKQSILKKLNMVIGTFFWEVGSVLLEKCTEFDEKQSEMSKQLIVTRDWTDQDFSRMKQKIKQHAVRVNCSLSDLDGLKTFLMEKRPFMLNLLGNSNLLEHESFTDLLWAVFHLTDELAHRNSLRGLPENDYTHLSGDMQRAYQHLLVQWLDYMNHLKQDYPYLFSLAMRTNPFDENASVEVA